MEQDSNGSSDVEQHSSDESFDEPPNLEVDQHSNGSSDDSFDEPQNLEEYFTEDEMQDGGSFTQLI